MPPGAWGLPARPAEPAQPDGLDALGPFVRQRATRTRRSRGHPSTTSSTWPIAIVGVLLLGSFVALTRAQAEAPTASVASIAPPAPTPSRRMHVKIARTLRHSPSTSTLLTRPVAPPPAPVQEGPATGSPSRAAQPSPAPTRRPPPPVAAPHPGRYALAISSNGGPDQDASLLVTGIGTADYREEFDDAGGTNRVDEQRWGATYIDVTNSAAGGQSCHWSPAAPWMARSLRIDETWHVRSSCPVTVDSQGHRATLTEHEDAKVVSNGYVDIGGQRLFVWAIQRVTTMTETDSRRVVATANERSTDLFAPQLGLVVQTTAQTQSPNRAGGSTPSYLIIRMVDTVPR